MNQPNHHALPIWQKILALAFFWLAAALTLHAQGTGKIQGRVYNPATKEYVRNAEVRLSGTTQTTYTENDGTFQFTNVAAGPATVTVQFVGYTTATENFTVSPGDTAVREINLVSAAAAAPATNKDGVVQLQAFTVASEREGNSKAIMAQRRDMNIINSVSSDVFGDVADGNVGEFLKYLPGVDLDYVESEARGPRLGGMDGQYVGVSFDGMRSASADANRGGGAASRATSFEGFSIASIESIEVNLTASAENDGDAPAGTINLKTKRAFDRKGRTFGYSTGVNLNGEEFTFKNTDGPGDYKDKKWQPNWSLDYAESFFNQRFGLSLSAAQTNSYTEQIVVTNGYNASPTATDTRPLVVRQIDTKDGPKYIHKDSLTLTADWKATRRLTLSMNMLYSYYDGEFWNRNFTYVAANDNANVNNGRSTVGGDGVTRVIATRATTGSVNNVATLNNGGGSSAKLVYTRQISPRFEYKLNSVVVDGGLAFSRSVNNYESIERGFSNSEGGGVASSWTASRDNARSAEWTIRQTSGPDWYNLANYTSTDSRSGGTRITNDDRTWETEKWTGILNARWAVPFMQRFPTALKFGGKWDEESRKNHLLSDVDIWAYTGPGGNTTTVSPTTGANVNATFGNWANLGPQFTSSNPFEAGRTGFFTVYNINGVQGTPPRVSRNAIATLFREHPEQWTNMATPENYYNDYIAQERNFRQTVSAAYTQADVRLNSAWSTRFGIRMEETRNRFMDFDPLSRAQVAAAGFPVNAAGTNSGRPVTIAGFRYQYFSRPKVERKSNYQSWFPSISTRYRITPDFEFQAGINKGIGRPAIDDLTGVWTVDETNQRVNAANAELLPEIHKVAKARAIYYFTGKSPGQLSVTVSQDVTTNYVQTFDYSAEEFGVDDPAYSNYTFRSKTNSNVTQRLRSMDFGYNQQLGFLQNEYLRGINFSFTYARTYADVRRKGVSPHRISSRFGYTYKRFNGYFAMIWADDKPESDTIGQYFGAITKFDIGLNFRLTRQAQLFISGRNISDQYDKWYRSPPGSPEGKNGYLRQIEGYGSNWMFGVKGSF